MQTTAYLHHSHISQISEHRNICNCLLIYIHNIWFETGFRSTTGLGATTTVFNNVARPKLMNTWHHEERDSVRLCQRRTFWLPPTDGDSHDSHDSIDRTHTLCNVIMTDHSCHSLSEVRVCWEFSQVRQNHLVAESVLFLPNYKQLHS